MTVPFPDDFGETFAFNLIKQNVAHFSFIFLTKFFAMSVKNLKGLHIVPTITYWTKVPHQCPFHFFCLFLFFTCSTTKQPYSKVDNSRMHRYRNAVFT